MVNVFINKLFFKFEIYKCIYSDQGKYSEAEIIRQLCNLYRVKKKRTTPYYPQGNGQCERFNRILHDLLRSLPHAKIIKTFSNLFIFLKQHIDILLIGTCTISSNLDIGSFMTFTVSIYIMTTRDHKGTNHGYRSIILE